MLKHRAQHIEETLQSKAPSTLPNEMTVKGLPCMFLVLCCVCIKKKKLK